jgi:hypothetical protein
MTDCVNTNPGREIDGLLAKKGLTRGDLSGCPGDGRAALAQW